MAAVPAPPGLAPPSPSVDTMQDLISRKRDAEKNKLKYHLTEADCSLLCTHGTTITYKAGQVIYNGDETISQVFRIKSGTIGLYRGDLQVKELTRGYFMGEMLFIRSSMKPLMACSCVAVTDTEVVMLNLPFARQLLSVDKVMAFKVYRHLAAKLSAFLFLSLSFISEDPNMQSYVLSRNLTTSDISSDSSDTSSIPEDPSTPTSIPASPNLSSISSSSLSGEQSLPSSDSRSSVSSLNGDQNDLGTQLYLKLKNTKLHSIPTRKKRAKATNNTPFRTFALDTPHGHCLLYPDRIKFTCVLRQRKIKYKQILDITKVGPTSVTIIFKLQARTIFFKTEEDMEEFLNLVKSLRLTNSKPSSPTSSSPLSVSYDDIGMTESDKVLLNDLSVVQTLKKGDIVIAEGDLFQRIYTVVSGQITSEKNGKQLMAIESGETFGVLSLYYLRPAMVNLVVTSETATVLIIPGYRIQELVSTNFSLAVRMHKKAAQVIFSQVENILSTSGIDGRAGEKPSTPHFKGANRALV